MTALQLLAVMKEEGQPLDKLAAQMERLPQLLVNVQVNTYIFPLVKVEIQDATPGCILNPAYNWQD